MTPYDWPSNPMAITSVRRHNHGDFPLDEFITKNIRSDSCALYGERKGSKILNKPNLVTCEFESFYCFNPLELHARV